jgi:hypothetical protein
MERNNRKNIFIMLISFCPCPGGHKFGYILSDQQWRSGSATGEGQTTIIRYEPSNSNIDPDAGIIFEAIEVITNNYFTPIEKEALIEGAVKGMIDSIDDPQLRFYNPEDLEEFLSETRGSYSGIGVRIIESYQ